MKSCKTWCVVSGVAESWRTVVSGEKGYSVIILPTGGGSLAGIQKAWKHPRVIASGKSLGVAINIAFIDAANELSMELDGKEITTRAAANKFLLRGVEVNGCPFYAVAETGPVDFHDLVDVAMEGFQQ